MKKIHDPSDRLDGTSLTYKDAHDIKLMLAAVRLANNMPLTPNLAQEWSNSPHGEHLWAYEMIDKS